ncbi:phospholipase D-like domain-containing protein [Rhodoferax antarcticus]|uniref:Cardiolipin synthase B n=1 Tax=Rhodoferax antarcticus ANT.BR TaxID=1111071 RepID=A0A1Q8YBD1_9BURK|nr:hypothetical protein [Rhodoferax antarcticus]APW46809.1 hypothetical protein RA876_11070 [Rhodoferax antarcticus]MCW2311297.1 phosphatidylserine/phosphatidylglycerophosphate/cardiolipin synthase-like enzyme [Rhodoferax antarcticus]OLP05307.1 cardiolipin synthase B [Rhodoferax antarcticus ANT.BR]
MKPPERLYSVDDPQFSRTVSAVLTPSLVRGNQVKMLLDGRQIFPAMLDALKPAKRSITFETYIFSASSIASEFEQAFVDAARRGVKAVRAASITEHTVS